MSMKHKAAVSAFGLGGLGQSFALGFAVFCERSANCGSGSCVSFAQALGVGSFVSLQILVIEPSY